MSSLSPYLSGSKEIASADSGEASGTAAASLKSERRDSWSSLSRKFSKGELPPANGGGDSTDHFSAESQSVAECATECASDAKQPDAGEAS